jgi:beta-N-acetylhexosaminidase
MSNQKSPFEPSKNDISRDFDFQPLPEQRQEPGVPFHTHDFLDDYAPAPNNLEQMANIQPFLHLPSRPKPDANDQRSGLKQFHAQHSPLAQKPQETFQYRPEPVLPRLKPKAQRRAINPFILVALITLTLLIVAGSMIEQHIWSPFSPQNQSSNAAKGSGFAQKPLSPQQIDDLRHIADRMNDQQLAYLDVQNMSLDEEIGQIMMVGYQENNYSSALDTMVHNLHAGAVILFQHQINTLAQTKADTAAMQKRADLPLLISTDEEGGQVQRLSSIFPPRPSAYQIRQTNSPDFAAQQGTQTAHDLLALGINTNLAPDVDVSTNNAYIGSEQRSFGDTSAGVIAYAGPYIKAMQTGGAIATLKHFPGLGGASAATNPHEVFVSVNHTQQQVDTIDLAPFKQFIHTTDNMEQPGLIMATDELMPSIDPTYIAELSPTFITKILRQQLGYQGVAITDDLTMLGVQVYGQHVALPQAGVLALKAGEDMLLGAYDVATMKAMIQAIKDALNNGTLTKSRLDDAATHVITLKIERNLIQTATSKNAS